MKKDFDIYSSEIILRIKNKHCLVKERGNVMGIAERKKSDKEVMRKKILDSAMKLFLSEGYDKVSIRKIADAIEYSPATVYLYFKDKTAIFNALQKVAFDKFYDTLAECLKIKDVKKRLDEMGELYMKFAMENPEYYDLMFIMSAPIDREKETCFTDDRAFNLLSGTIEEVFKKKGIKNIDVEATAFLLWGFSHGLASLIIRKRLATIPDEHLKGLFLKISKMLDKKFFQ
ncbi:MAG: TetR/AcrR family transcriptional regulator [Ignavibacteriaceae bacterium]|jgi:AcrR family transcriptional regulator